ncbi:MAG: hypothetical protein QXO25_06325 [Candidatus Bathyarchaeia archaeon]
MYHSLLVINSANAKKRPTRTTSIKMANGLGRSKRFPRYISTNLLVHPDPVLVQTIGFVQSGGWIMILTRILMVYERTKAFLWKASNSRPNTMIRPDSIRFAIQISSVMIQGSAFSSSKERLRLQTLEAQRRPPLYQLVIVAVPRDSLLEEACCGSAVPESRSRAKGPKTAEKGFYASLKRQPHLGFEKK